MSNNFCKGGCGNEAIHKGWCSTKWFSGKRFGVGCPKIEEKRGKSISRYRLAEAKLGKNPMQNPIICKRNHSPERNRKAAETLRKLGEKGLLPQQTESKELKEKRRLLNKETLKKLWDEGKHPRQKKSKQEKELINKKIAKTLSDIAARGELPIQNFRSDKKKEIAKRVSKKLREGIREGRIKLSRGWKKVHYKNKILRSNWEKVTAEFLDRNNIEWEYESFIIPYYDTQRDLVANTIPDFYLPKYNAIIEVKSNAEYKSVQTLDKMDAIHKQGFKAFLFGRKQIKAIERNEAKLLRMIKNEES